LRPGIGPTEAGVGNEPKTVTGNFEKYIVRASMWAYQRSGKTIDLPSNTMVRPWRRCQAAVRIAGPGTIASTMRRTEASKGRFIFGVIKYLWSVRLAHGWVRAATRWWRRSRWSWWWRRSKEIREPLPESGLLLCTLLPGCPLGRLDDLLDSLGHLVSLLQFFSGLFVGSIT